MARHVIKFDYDEGVKLAQPVVWCGHPITYRQWMFTDAQHVALSVGGSVKPCANCIRAIITELQKEL